MSASPSRRATTASRPGTARGRRAARGHAAASGLSGPARPCRPAHRPADRLAGASGPTRQHTVRLLWHNGASQEGGPLGRVHAVSPCNFKTEPMAEKRKRIDDIGRPDMHSKVPQGRAVASNAPLRRSRRMAAASATARHTAAGHAARGMPRRRGCHRSAAGQCRAQARASAAASAMRRGRLVPPLPRHGLKVRPPPAGDSHRTATSRPWTWPRSSPST